MQFKFGNLQSRIKTWVGLIMTISLVTLLNGCGIFTQTWDTTSYKSPNWAESGNILAVKEVVVFERTPISESSTGGYSVIVEMDPNGENEHELFRISGSETVNVVERSASGNVVAYINDSSYLNVYQNQGGRWVKLWTKTPGENIDLVKICVRHFWGFGC